MQLQLAGALNSLASCEYNLWEISNRVEYRIRKLDNSCSLCLLDSYGFEVVVGQMSVSLAKIAA